MAKLHPSGLGVWIAYGSKISSNVDDVVTKLKTIGANWVAPRLGQGGRRDIWYTARLAKEFVTKCHANNILVYPWIYNAPGTMHPEIELFKVCIDEGSDGILLDPEVPYNERKQEAKDFVTLLKQTFPNTYIGYAPFAYFGYHQDYPYVEFGKLDGCMTQEYWTEFNNKGAKYNLDKIEEQFNEFLKKNPNTAKKYPIGATYGQDLGIKWKIQQVPPGKITVEDVQYFLDKYSHLECYSLYTLDAMEDIIFDFLSKRKVKFDLQEVATHKAQSELNHQEVLNHEQDRINIEQEHKDNINNAADVLHQNHSNAVDELELEDRLAQQVKDQEKLKADQEAKHVEELTQQHALAVQQKPNFIVMLIIFILNFIKSIFSNVKK